MTYSRRSVRLRAIPAAGPWAWYFTLLAVACFALVGVTMAAGDYVWTFALAVSGLVNLHELDDVLREVSA